jgi:hypothetical protein
VTATLPHPITRLPAWWRRRVLLSGRLSTTRIVLARLRAALLLGIVLVLATSYLAYQQAHDTVTAAGSRSAIAVLNASVAQQALIEADAAMVAGLAGNVVQRGAQATTYRDDLALAGQSLQGVGQFDVVGNPVSLDLQQVEGQLTIYSGLVAQAYVDYGDGTATDSARLGLVEVVYASKLMHSGGILDTLHALFLAEQQAFDAQVSSGWLSAPAALLWAVPAAALLVLLVATQIVLARRFRRKLNAGLLAATALLLILAGCIGVITGIEASRLDGTRDAVATVLADRRVTPGALSGGGGTWEARVLDGMCGQAAQVGCGSASLPRGVTPTRQETDATDATDRAAAAPDEYGLRYVIPGLGAVVIASLWLGIHLRIRDYRYEAR